VFGLSRALQVWVYTEPTDMRKSFNTLSALVTEEMHREVLSGDLFVFISKDRKRAKVLHFDGTGLIVWAKRLERGRFAPLYRKKREGGLEGMSRSLLNFATVSQNGSAIYATSSA